MISEKAKRQGFTLIEIMLVVVIIILLATVILASISSSRKNARLVNARTSARTALPIIISCKDSGGTVSIPSGSEDGNQLICPGSYNSSFWPALGDDYQYVAGGAYDIPLCNFQISTNGDRAANIVCNCASQKCD